MAPLSGSVRGARVFAWPSACLLLCFGYFSVAFPNHGRRLICWQAIFNCQSEPACHYAYEQYLRACEPILTGHKKKCPSHCINSLVQLNMTKNGPALEDCSCASDSICLDTKRAIEPCLPKTSSMGCTEARRQCERDFQCRTSMSEYMFKCSKLFSGATCTSACRSVIADMRKLPKAQLLDKCQCDGSERTICEHIKSSMKDLCFDSPPVDEEGSGSDDYGEDDDDYVEYKEVPGNAASPSPARGAFTLLLASILVVLPLI